MVMTTHGPRVSSIVAALGAAYSAAEAAASTNAPAGSSSSVQQVDHLKPWTQCGKQTEGTDRTRRPREQGLAALSGTRLGRRYRDDK